MPDDALEILEVRLARVEESLRAIEGRLSLLDGRRPQGAPASAGAVPVESESPFDATLVARSVLIVGGGYVLRALTELHVVGDLAGVALGLLYALFWIWAADRAMSRGRRMVALFDAGTAAGIAGALIWEATSRFHLLTVSVASALVVIVAFAICFVARRQQSTTMAMMASVMTTMACIGLTVSTVDPVAPMVAASIVGVVLSRVSIKPVTLVVAAASDMLAVALAVITAVREPAQGVLAAELALIAVAALWLLSSELGQSVVATIVGLGGAAVIAQVHGAHVVPVAIACLVIGAAIYAKAFARPAARTLLIAGAAAVGIGSLLALRPSAVAMAWAIAAAVSAAVGMNIFAACWALAASVVAGLPAAFIAAFFSSSPATLRPSLPLLVVCLSGAVAVWISAREARGTRLTLLGITTLIFMVIVLPGFANLAPDRPAVALARTFVLAAAAVLLAMLSVFIAEAKTIATIVLILGGAKLLIEDLRVGRASTVVVALALYGFALLIVARRRVNAVSDSRPTAPA